MATKCIFLQVLLKMQRKQNTRKLVWKYWNKLHIGGSLLYGWIKKKNVAGIPRLMAFSKLYFNIEIKNYFFGDPRKKDTGDKFSKVNEVFNSRKWIFCRKTVYTDNHW